MKYHIFLGLVIFALCAAAAAENVIDSIAVDFIGIQSGRAVFQITNKSKDVFSYVRFEPTKSFENSSIQTYKNKQWENSGPFKCGTMTEQEAAQYVSHKLNPNEQILTSMSLEGVSSKAGDVIRIQVSLMKENQFFEAYSDSQTMK